MSPIESSLSTTIYETIKLQIIVSYIFNIYLKSTLDCMESPLCFGFSALGLNGNILQIEH